MGIGHLQLFQEILEAWILKTNGHLYYRTILSAHKYKEEKIKI